MEDLTKTQLILLMLLVSFVVSIATGITTVTLMDQAPESIIQPITKVIRETVEMVVPGETKTITETNTIIIKEEDLIVKAIENNQKSLVNLYSFYGETEEKVGTGFFVSANGLFIIGDNTLSKEKNYQIKINEKEIEMNLLINNEKGFSILKAISSDESEVDLKFNFSSLKNLEQAKAGQKVVVLYDQPVKVGVGIISELETIVEEINNQNQEYVLMKLNIDLPEMVSGGPLINLDGDVIGIAILEDGKVNGINSKIIRASIDKI